MICLKQTPILVTAFNEYKKERDCIFAEFTKGVPHTIPSTQILPLSIMRIVCFMHVEKQKR